MRVPRKEGTRDPYLVEDGFNETTRNRKSLTRERKEHRDEEINDLVKTKCLRAMRMRTVGEESQRCRDAKTKRGCKVTRD